MKTKAFPMSVNYRFSGPSVECTPEIVPIERNEHGPRYAVMLEGKRIGHIEKRNATFESGVRPSGVVLHRWQSLRWFGDLEPMSKDRLYHFPRETREGAVRIVMEAYFRAKSN